MVISTSDPKTSHLFVKKLIEEGLKYGKWVQHWGDPLSGDITSSLIFPQSYIRKVEKNMISKADKIVYVSHFTAEMQKNNYPKFNELLSILEKYNGRSGCTSYIDISFYKVNKYFGYTRNLGYKTIDFSASHSSYKDEKEAYKAS